MTGPLLRARHCDTPEHFTTQTHYSASIFPFCSSQTDCPSGLKLSTYPSIYSLRGSPLHAPSCHSVTLSACHYITLMHPPTTLVMQRQTCMRAQREALLVVVSERFAGGKWQKAILKTFSHIFCTNELKRTQSLHFIRLNFRPVPRAAARRCFDRTDAPTFSCLPMLLTSSGTSRSLTNLPDIFIRSPVYSAGGTSSISPSRHQERKLCQAMRCETKQHSERFD